MAIHDNHKYENNFKKIILKGHTYLNKLAGGTRGLILKISPIIAGKMNMLYISIAKVWIFLWRRKKLFYLGVPEMLIYNQNKQFLMFFCVHC